MTGSQGKVRIKGKDFRLLQPCPVTFTGKDFAGARFLGKELRHENLMAKSLQIDSYLNCIETCHQEISFGLFTLSTDGVGEAGRFGARRFGDKAVSCNFRPSGSSTA